MELHMFHHVRLRLYHTLSFFLSFAERRVPAEIIVHDTWKTSRPSDLRDDIALIRLDKAVTTIFEDLNSVVMPICLGFPLANPAEAAEVLTAGWGKISNRDVTDESLKELGISVRTLQRLRVPIIDQRKCRLFASNVTTQICAGGEEGKKKTEEFNA